MKELLGNYEPVHFAVLLFYAYLGALISLLIHSTNRKTVQSTTPYGFSIKYLFKDNIARVVLNIILIAVSIRFAPDVIGKEIGTWGALGVGISYDKLLEFFRNMNVIDVKK